MKTAELCMSREDAIDRLSQSARGRSAIRQLVAWLDHDGISLDRRNQEAVLSLLIHAWDRPGSTRDLMREVMAEEQAEMARRKADYLHATK